MDVEFNWNKPVKQVAEEKAGGKNGLLFLANEAICFWLRMSGHTWPENRELYIICHLTPIISMKEKYMDRIILSWMAER